MKLYNASHHSLHKTHTQTHTQHTHAHSTTHTHQMTMYTNTHTHTHTQSAHMLTLTQYTLTLPHSTRYWTFPSGVIRLARILTASPPPQPLGAGPSPVTPPEKEVTSRRKREGHGSNRCPGW